MLSCGALERSNNSYIEWIAEPCVSKNQKSESEFVFKKCKSLIQKEFKSAELLTKASFFIYFKDRPKNGEGNKQGRRRKYARQSS